MPSALDVRDLTKRFGAVAALRGVSFSVEPGEVFGYLGPNGAGKTTTLRVILGLVRADGGSARILGIDSREPASRAHIGFLPGDLRLYPDMTAAATLDFFAGFRPSRPPVLRERLLEALEVDGSTLARRVKFLSHGTRQKIGLIAAMQHDPALLLLDEPSNGLDPLVQRAFLLAAALVLAGFEFLGCAIVASVDVESALSQVMQFAPPIVRAMIEQNMPGGSPSAVLAFAWNHPVAHALARASPPCSSTCSCCSSRSSPSRSPLPHSGRKPGASRSSACSWRWCRSS